MSHLSKTLNPPRLPSSPNASDRDPGGTRETPCFKSHVRSRIDLGVYNKEVKPYYEAARERKGNFLDASFRSDVAIQDAAKKYQKQGVKWTALLVQETRNKIDAYIAAVDADVISTNQHLKVLDHAVGVKTRRKDYERDRLENLLLQMQGDLIVLQEQKSQVVGEWVDDIIRSSQLKHLCDWDYIERLAQWQKRPSTARLPLFKGCTDSTQERFRETVFNAYGSKVSTPEPLIWCCIQGRWWFDRYVEPARLVPYEMGEVQAAHLFGQPVDNRGHLMNPESAISVAREYSSCIKDGDIALMPVENSNDVRIVVLDPLHRPYDLIHQVDGKLLSFHNDFRPAKRYLYFAFATALMRLYRTKGPGEWLSLVSQLPRWVIPGVYPRASALIVMAQRFARMSADHALQILSLERGENEKSLVSKPGVQDNLVSDYFTLWIVLDREREIEALKAWENRCGLCG